jgi:hypothetical protein
MYCQTRRSPRGCSAHRTGERPPHKPISSYPFGAAVRAPQPRFPPLFLALYPLLASPASVSGGVFTALWDANSTAVCWACQEGSPIYCISVLTLGMPVWSRSFSTSEFSRFTPAFEDARKACVSFGLRVRRIVEANWQASAPWAHRYPRRFHGVQRDKSRRKTQPNSRRRGRCVRGRERPRT